MLPIFVQLRAMLLSLDLLKTSLATSTGLKESQEYILLSIWVTMLLVVVK